MGGPRRVSGPLRRLMHCFVLSRIVAMFLLENMGEGI